MEEVIVQFGRNRNIKLGLPDPRSPRNTSQGSETASTLEQLVIHPVATIYLPPRPSALLTASYPQHDKTSQDLQ